MMPSLLDMPLSVALYGVVVLGATVLAYRLSASVSVRLAEHIDVFPGESWRRSNQALECAVSALGFVVLAGIPLVLWDVLSAFSDMVAMQLAIILCGFLLGVGELSFSEFLCLLVQKLRNPSALASERQGGFASREADQPSYSNPVTYVRLSPIYLIYAAVEELALRAGVIILLAAYGTVVSVMAAVTLSILHQFATRPERSHLWFILVGTLVTATTHSILFAYDQDLVGLIAARFVVLLRRGP